jgi:signal transduction histidine kinase
LVSALLGTLILAIVAVGVVLIVQNERVKEVTGRALRYDVEIEDEGDDVRIAVLDLRHFHRNIAFNGPSDATLASFDQAYLDLLDELDDLVKLGISDPNVPQPATILAGAERYYAEFRPAIASYERDPAAFDEASAAGLRRISEMDVAAQAIDDLGEQLASAAFRRVDSVTTNERMMLLALVGGVVLVGVALAVSVGRVLAGLRGAYAREQDAALHLSRALRTKTDFIADASHELRTPLTVIRGNAEIGLSTADEGVRGAALGDIATEAKRMAGLVDDLLFLARSDAGVPPLEREFVPARWLLRGVAQRAEALARQRGATLTTAIGGDGYLEVDPDRIEQAVLVLVDNAVKHAAAGAEVNLRSESRAGALRIDVVDNGPGIPAEDLPLVFDRFYQVGDRRARKKGGSGLGLSIARSIVQAHGGSLVADSALGRGTTMTIVLPLCPHPEPSPAAAPEVTTSAPRTERAGTGLRARLQAGGAATAASRQ